MCSACLVLLLLPPSLCLFSSCTYSTLLCCHLRSSAFTYSAVLSTTLLHPHLFLCTLLYLHLLCSSFTHSTLLLLYFHQLSLLFTYITLLCSYYFSTLLYSNLVHTVLYCILTYPTLLLLILCNHLTWLGARYWCTQA